MHDRLRNRAVAALVTSTAVAVVGVGVGIAGSKRQRITSRGVGVVELGATYDRLRHARAIGTIHAGCVLAGSNARAADLSAPLEGTVDFTMSSPRKVADLSVTYGAAARGVGIGGSIKDIKAKFTHVVVDHTGEGLFALTFARIPKGRGGPMEVCLARMLRSEVEVLFWSPIGGIQHRRQGRGPELTGRSQCGQVWRCGASVRAGLKEAVDASWWRTKVKRRKAFLGGGEPASSGDARFLLLDPGA